MATLHEVIEAPEQRALFRWWLEARGARLMPARADFDPLDHPALLPRLFLVTAAVDPLQFRYRLCGTEIDEHQGYAMTGKTFGQLFTGELLRFTAERFADTAFNRRISYHTTQFSNDNTLRATRFNRLLLPLSNDGTRVDTIIGSRVRVAGGRRSFAELSGGAAERLRYEVLVVDAADADRGPARSPYPTPEP